MRKRSGILTVLAFSVLGATGQAAALLVPITNPSFEIHNQAGLPASLGDGQFTTQANAVTGWTHDATAGTWNPFASAYPGGAVPPGGGSNAAFSTSGTLSQTLTGTTLAPNTTYTLQVWVGDRSDTGFPGYQVQLLAGSTVLNQCISCVTPANGAFALATVSYTSPASVTPGQVLGIVLDSVGNQTNWDLISLDASSGPPAAHTPEPGTLLLIGSGLAGIGVLRRSRKWLKSADT